MPRIFAFGTLKKGFPLHEEGLAGAKFLGAYRTVERFPLVIAGPWFAPMMLYQPGIGLNVRGELYEIEDARLQILDALESVGELGNLRVVLELSSLAGDDACSAFAYLKALELAALRHRGFLEDYQDRRFIPPSRRPRR